MNNLKTNRECNIIICVTIMLIISFSLSNCHKLKFPPSEFEIGDIYLGSAFDLYLEGDYAYVMYNEGMAIIDISDLNKPNKITIVKTEESAYGILLKNNIAFLGSGGENNFKINNISNKKDPDILSELSVQGAITAIAGNENMQFLSTWDGNLIIIDVSDLYNPEIVSVSDCDGNGNNLVFNNNTVYYANSQKGLQIFDVNDLTSPEITDVAESSDGAKDIDIKNGYLFLGRHNRGISIYRIEESDSLTLVSEINNGGETWGVTYENEILYTADLQEGVEIFDITDIEHPTIISTIEEYAPHDIAVRNGYIFLADQDRNFIILDISN